MPPGLARYWAAKRKAKKAPRKKKSSSKYRVGRIPRATNYGPTRASLKRDVRAHHARQVRTAKQLIQEELKAMRNKLSLLNKGISGRAGRRK